MESSLRATVPTSGTAHGRDPARDRRKLTLPHAPLAPLIALVRKRVIGRGWCLCPPAPGGDYENCSVTRHVCTVDRTCLCRRGAEIPGRCVVAENTAQQLDHGPSGRRCRRHP